MSASGRRRNINYRNHLYPPPTLPGLERPRRSGYFGGPDSRLQPLHGPCHQRRWIKSKQQIGRRAFIFLAVMMYTMPPAKTLGRRSCWRQLSVSSHRCPFRDDGPRFLPSAIRLFRLSWRRWFIEECSWCSPAALCLQGKTVRFWTFCSSRYASSVWFNMRSAPSEHVAFSSFCLGKGRMAISQESLIWTLITQVANVTSAALFYSAIHGAGVPFLFVGGLIIVLVHLLYRFNEKRVSEVSAVADRKAQVHRRDGRSPHEHDRVAGDCDRRERPDDPRSRSPNPNLCDRDGQAVQGR